MPNENNFLEKALLVQVETTKVRRILNFENSFEEFKDLARSAGVNILGEIKGKQELASPRYFIQKGKLEEIKLEVHKNKIGLVIFNHTLSPSQERNIERYLKARVLDRTGLILDIFARRAFSHIGKLQVELAQLSHLSTRLVRGWSHLERQKGGIGLRGPGETQLETDRRLIGNRIKALKKKLTKSHNQKSLNRYARKKGKNKIVALVGYTNAGKTTLFNALTGGEEYKADQLFATLDSVTRKNLSPGSRAILFTDTVGFISEIPTELIESFKTTLDDLRSAEVDFITIGQYLQPSPKHHPLNRYYHPDEFKKLEQIAKTKGFLLVSSSPLTRSSYHADEDFRKLQDARNKQLECHQHQ